MTEDEPELAGATPTTQVDTIFGDRYRTIRLLGHGGFGSVYEAEHLEIRRRVAIKVLHPHLAHHKEFLTRFRREALASTAIESPHVVEMTDSGPTADGSLFLVMEYLEGTELSGLLESEGPLRLGRAVRIAMQLCDALAAAHGAGIVHRDLKPDNVFLIERGGDPDFVKVLDFGISKFEDAGDASTMVTRTGATLGTPAYMSPEQAQGQKGLDGRADQYSLAVILFRALTDQLPFEDESFPMLILKICTEPPPPVDSFRTDLPAEFAAVITRMLDKDPTARFRDCAEVKAALAPFQTVADDPVLAEGVARATRPSALDGRMKSSLATAPTTPQMDVVSSAEVHEDDLPQEALNVIKSRGGGGLKWAALLGLVVLLGVVAWLSMADEQTAEGGEQTAPPSLPTPGPPQVRALVSPAPDGLAWQWVNPLPRAMPAWHDVEVGGVGMVGMVGPGGRAARFLAGRLLLWSSGVEADLVGLVWLGTHEAVAVGDGGTITRLQRGAPQVIASGTELDLRAVVAASPTEVVVVGSDGVVLRVAGDVARPIDSGSDRDLLGATARGSDVFIVGEGGVILRLRGDTVEVEREGSGTTLRAVGGCPDQGLYAVGDDGRVLRRGDDGSWARLGDTGRQPWDDISCDHFTQRAVAAGLRGGVLLLSGDRAVELESGTDRPLRGVGGAPERRTWIVGDSGRMAQLEGDHLRILTSGPTSAILGVGALGGAMVAVGQWGKILREDQSGLREAESPTDAALGGLALLAEDRLIAVGDQGALVQITWDEATLIEAPSQDSWRDVVAHEGALLAVGAGGAVLRGVPGALSADHVDGVEAFWSVTGAPGDAVAVGDGGAIYAMSDAGQHRLACDFTGSLRGVLRTDDGIFAVGVGGVILRIDEQGCAREREGGPTLNGVGLGPHGRPFAVGDGATAFERGEDGAWVEVQFDAADASLRRVYRTERDVFVVGSGGVVLRHPAL